jgi:hypothetical protein
MLACFKKHALTWGVTNFSRRRTCNDQRVHGTLIKSWLSRLKSAMLLNYTMARTYQAKQAARYNLTEGLASAYQLVVTVVKEIRVVSGSYPAAGWGRISAAGYAGPWCSSLHRTGFTTSGYTAAPLCTGQGLQLPVIPLCTG